ncbi:MAG: tRNA (adenosine(37)-N6)-threonylcarbamoyltransferase complex dimerization subunit type 1 TsaB [Ignavibacteriae bacterium HGW-Ignavibacteriae-2]|jgi:tRNA threonylcarbamoyladenosine biosynthesis protein TsaB|nr:tRNA (adenosine(37)-N6)-threonylcarbamoyltransferase complex dimerization subunit type 1 TsaB [Bacteroidota bacterium]PKL87796.1 MAG: tRNA (adenosine(37)-N6)-threonylcarbamoyltransferase complex dimerization subunit type 1 TsaB [Ignavibacteriae bacterium HGW-Ignavibacteriae-2]
MDNNLPILAVETSGEMCSVAILQNGNVFAESCIQKKHIHSQKLYSLIEQVLLNLDLSLQQISSIAISVGPGSFTGLRIGMSAVKGIAFGLNVPVIPVGTFDASSFQLFDLNRDLKNLAIVSKVNTTELYVQKFSRDIKSENGNLEIITNDELEKYAEGYQLYGNIKHNSVIPFESPSAVSIAKWAYIFGEDLLTSDYDYLEPNYVKKFVVRTIK